MWGLWDKVRLGTMFAQMSEDEMQLKSQFIEEALENWEAWEYGELFD